MRCAAASVCLWLWAAPALAIAAPPLTASFATDDGWRIAATYRKAETGKPTAILVHGAAAGRGEWDELAAALAARGWGTLAIDLRGHGDSTAGPSGRADFRGFDAADGWQRAEKDVLAAAKFLENRGAGRGKLVLIGASIGANLCSRAARSLKPRALVLLSPGADYRGVTLGRFDPARTLAASSPSDPYADATVRQLKRIFPALSALSAASGHGVQMLADPALKSRLLAFLWRLDGA